jgi:hypothetical protein
MGLGKARLNLTQSTIHGVVHAEALTVTSARAGSSVVLTALQLMLRE